MGSTFLFQITALGGDGLAVPPGSLPSVLIGGVFQSLFLQTGHQLVQPPPPEAVKPCLRPELRHNGGTDGVVAPDEGPTQPPAGQDLIPEASQGPDLGAVVAAVDAGGHIAALGSMAGRASGGSSAGAVPALLIAFLVALLTVLIKQVENSPINPPFTAVTDF